MECCYLTSLLFRPVLKIPDPVNVILFFCKVRAVTDAEMIKFTHIKHIITTIKIGVNNTISFTYSRITGNKGRLRIREGCINLGITPY
ncbi:hypothetical protein C7N83_12645 [Neisseria iguanae]|uniref:Uncharacterized protein n=1 Tax=Neisseria iguanae TaxID=90242 RepID=A0A2P7TXB9_9NEIS|nr:hypothetical protein C7N83_12645 [Neisseria iguanae]